MSMDAIIYAAKSTADTKGSIPDQLKDARGLCEADGYPVVGEYQDENKSAYKGSRGDGLLKAMEHAERIAPCVLVVQHSDRLARGDSRGGKGAHLLKYVLWAREMGVTLRSCQDDDLDDVLRAAISGERNTEDSSRKEKATKAGLKRTAERGEWRGGIVPGGYEVQYDHDAQGKVIGRRLVKHAEDHAAYDLLWSLAVAGRSVQAISLEMNRRGYKTRPPHRHIKPKDFDTSRVIQALSCPAYAGLIVWDGETYTAQWEPYVDVATFHQLKAERHERCHHTKRKRGRPPVGYLLAELARCGLCGEPMHAETDRRRSDGSIARRYTCRAHREHHREDAGWCPCERFDAEAVDRAVVGGIERLLGDASALREQLESGQRAERENMERVAAEATKAAKAAEASAERATQEFADAEDADERALLKDAAKVKRADAKRERTRADAALDALNAAEPEPDTEGAMNALWMRLQEQITAAGEDVKVLNAAMRESFEKFELRRIDNGQVLVIPTLSAEAARRALADVPADATVPSMSDAGLGLPAILV
jgi:site-specific DNA recombinase